MLGSPLWHVPSASLVSRPHFATFSLTMADCNLLGPPTPLPNNSSCLKLLKSLKQPRHALEAYKDSRHKLNPVPENLAEVWCAGIGRVILEGEKGTMEGRASDEKKIRNGREMVGDGEGTPLPGGQKSARTWDAMCVCCDMLTE